MGARERILTRVRSAAPRGGPADRADVRPARSATGTAASRRPAVGSFTSRLEELGAAVTILNGPGHSIPLAVAAACERHGATRVLAPDDLPAAWTGGSFRPTLDASLDRAMLSDAHAAVTGCALAIAATGTIILDGGAAQGRRALSLLPDLHVCIVDSADIVGDVPEAIHRLAESLRLRRGLATLITGPSATSDIELRRIEGVHGPRKLEVLILS